MRRNQRTGIAAGIVGVLALVLAFGSAQGATLYWIGGDTGNWTDAANWTGGDEPDAAGEDAVIDNNAGQDTTVTLGRYTREIGTLTVDAGDTFRYAPSSNTLTLGGLSNSGTIYFYSSPDDNIRTGYFIVNGTNQTFNASGASIQVSNNSGRNRIHVIFTLDAQNRNDGDISVSLTANSDRDTVRMGLSNSGTFTNNGTILIQNTQSPTSSDARLQLLTASSAVTLGGSGTLTLDVGTLTDPTRARIIGGSSTDYSTLTNASSHTIDGAGLIGGYGLDLTNEGLVLATGDTAALKIDPYSATSNTSTGRMVASGAGGLIVGASGDTFTNNGLLEARSGSSVTIGASTVVLNGTIAGGGTYDSSLSLSGAATLSPGNLANANGTGGSTVGATTVTGNLELSDATVLEYQLGAAGTPGTDYDMVNVTGDLTLDGVLNVTDLTGFQAGQYVLLTYTGTLTDNGLSLGTMPDGFTYNVTNTGASNGSVILHVIPEPATMCLLALGGAACLLRRSK